ncbi:hypothetical protein GCM10027056_21430 [Glaciibacter psychrotolerans]
MTRPLANAVLALGIAAVVGSAFALTGGLPPAVHLIEVPGASAWVLLGLGLLAIVASRVRSVALTVVSGAAFVGAALLQLVQLGRSANLLGGNASTMALIGGLGIGLLVVALVARNRPPSDERE